MRTDFLCLAERTQEAFGARSSVINCGPRQDVGQVHMHLTDEPLPIDETHSLQYQSWEQAVVSLSGVADVSERLKEGFSLVQNGVGSAVFLS